MLLILLNSVQMIFHDLGFQVSEGQRHWRLKTPSLKKSKKLNPKKKVTLG